MGKPHAQEPCLNRSPPTPGISSEQKSCVWNTFPRMLAPTTVRPAARVHDLKQSTERS
jgi:hypothetical protein